MVRSRDVVERVRMEYLEMPGLALTCRQAGRLFHLDAGVCEDILAQLVREDFLSRSVSGIFLRCAAGPHLFPRCGPPPSAPPTSATAERL